MRTFRSRKRAQELLRRSVAMPNDDHRRKSIITLDKRTHRTPGTLLPPVSSENFPQRLSDRGACASEPRSVPGNAPQDGRRAGGLRDRPRGRADATTRGGGGGGRGVGADGAGAERGRAHAERVRRHRARALLRSAKTRDRFKGSIAIQRPRAIVFASTSTTSMETASERATSGSFDAGARARSAGTESVDGDGGVYAPTARAGRESVRPASDGAAGSLPGHVSR